MLYLAPLHGLTDVIFRNVYFRHFRGFDKAVAPFVSLTPGDKITALKVRGLSPQLNDVRFVIPQILGNDADGFLLLGRFLIREYGYREINWNLGCPVTNIAKKQRGSGLLPFPEKIDRFLDKVMAGLNGELSVKLRLGYNNSREFEAVTRVLNNYPLKSVTVHPRIGTQMYSGTVLLHDFEKMLPLISHRVIYNGDIFSRISFRNIAGQFPQIHDFMLGRGILFNPFLAEMITEDNNNLPFNALERFRAFYHDLEISEKKARKPWMNKMKEYWKFFERFFDLDSQGLITLQKCTSEQEWNKVTGNIMGEA